VHTFALEYLSVCFHHVIACYNGADKVSA